MIFNPHKPGVDRAIWNFSHLAARVLSGLPETTNGKPTKEAAILKAGYLGRIEVFWGLGYGNTPTDLQFHVEASFRQHVADHGEDPGYGSGRRSEWFKAWQTELTKVFHALNPPREHVWTLLISNGDGEDELFEVHASEETTETTLVQFAKERWDGLGPDKDLPEDEAEMVFEFFNNDCCTYELRKRVVIR